jgi:alpha-ribazole phosphatase
MMELGLSEISTHDEIAASEAVNGGFVRTSWWWIRHAPVRVDKGCIYGQTDLPCDCSDTAVFAGLAAHLPREAIWLTSNLIRTHQTAAAIWAARGDGPQDFVQDKDLAEQHLGDWQGLDRQSFLKGRKQEPDSYWYAAADERAPNGESFVDLFTRVDAAVKRANEAYKGRDIIAVAHGGTIRAAIAIALGLPPRGGLAFTIDNCSVTRLDHYRDSTAAGWRVVSVNHRP